MNNKTIKEIAVEWLKANGYDGLYQDCGDCACLVDDLMPCMDELTSNCTAGYKTKCNPDDCPLDGDCEWHISEKKEA